MRRLAAILVVALAIAALLSFGSGAREEAGDEYLVRGIFDNGAFLVEGEEIRIAGARVGSVADVDVTGEDDWVHSDRSPEPGKAVVVMRIDDEGFQDFRSDASCLIRPQSLLGEKFVECDATQPRAPGSNPPPPLELIPDGEPGAGQRFLPLEQNGKVVDLDLVTNIMREPYPDRFRLILNDLGAGLAARGEELEEIVERGNPALRETDEVLAILAEQNRVLADLARDGDQVLAPLARQRDRISGFINNATVAGQATAERSAELEAGLQRLPGFLHELRLTMAELRSFSDSSTPVIADLGDAAPALTRITRATGPFADGATRALVTLGDASEQAGDDLEASQPVLEDLRRLSEQSTSPARTLTRLLSSLRTTGGYEFLGQTIFNANGAVNGFDDYGHFLRTLLPTNNCVDYRPNFETSCESFFSAWNSGAKAEPVQPKYGVASAREAPARSALDGMVGALDGPGALEQAEPDPDAESEGELPGGDEPPADPEDASDLEDEEIVLDFLYGSEGAR